MTEMEKMLLGLPYLPQDLELRQKRKKVQKLLKQFNKLFPAQRKKRYELIRKIFMSTGVSCSVYPPFYCDYGCNIAVGDNFFAKICCAILDDGMVTIGNNVMLGPGVMILAASHPIHAADRQQGYGLGRSVTIGDDVWVGAHSTINPGVHIGCNTIIGAGSVVTRSIPDNVIAVGNPCKVLRNISKAKIF